MGTWGRWASPRAPRHCLCPCCSLWFLQGMVLAWCRDLFGCFDALLPLSCGIVSLIFNHLCQLIPSLLSFRRCTLTNLKKHSSSSCPEPCQMKSTSKNQVNVETIKKQPVSLGKAGLGGSHRETRKRKQFLGAEVGTPAPREESKKKKRIIFFSFLCFPVLFRWFFYYFFLNPWQKIGSQLWYPPPSARGWG